MKRCRKPYLVFESLIPVEIVCRKEDLQRYINEQERQRGCILRDVKAPLLFTHYHEMFSHGGRCVCVAVITPKWFSWSVMFARYDDKK